MVIFNSYVSLPEGKGYPMFNPHYYSISLCWMNVVGFDYAGANYLLLGICLAANNNNECQSKVI